MKEYPNTLAAVDAAEFSKWPIVDALLQEIEMSAGTKVKAGEYDRVAQYLARNGYASYSPKTVEKLYGVGRWLNEIPAPAREFRSYPFEWVIEARKAAKSDPDVALAILAKARSKRDIRPDKVTPAQIVQAVKDNPQMASAIAKDTEASRAVTSAQVDEGIRRRETGGTGFTVDEGMTPTPGPWRLLVSAFQDIHRAWKVWNDDISWGMLRMDEGDDAVRRELAEIEEAIRILQRMQTTGRAFVQNTIGEEVEA